MDEEHQSSSDPSSDVSIRLRASVLAIFFVGLGFVFSFMLGLRDGINGSALPVTLVGMLFVGYGTAWFLPEALRPAYRDSLPFALFIFSVPLVFRLLVPDLPKTVLPVMTGVVIALWVSLRGASAKTDGNA